MKRPRAEDVRAALEAAFPEGPVYDPDMAKAIAVAYRVIDPEANIDADSIMTACHFAATFQGERNQSVLPDLKRRLGSRWLS